jgi:hypothetical protein
VCFPASSVKHGVGCDCSACMARRVDIENYTADTSGQWVLREVQGYRDPYWLSTAPARTGQYRDSGVKG